MKKQVKQPEKIECLWHIYSECICIHPVKTELELQKRIKNAEGLKRFGVEVKR